MAAAEMCVNVGIESLNCMTSCCAFVQILKVRPDIGAIVVKGAVPGKPGNVLEITPAKIVGKNIGPQLAKRQKEAAGKAN